MKNLHTSNERSKKQLDKDIRIKLLGWVFLLLAFSLAAFGFVSQHDLIIRTTEDQREGYYMMGLVFGAMGLFCIRPLSKLRVHRFLGLFWPLFDAGCRGNIRMLILSPATCIKNRLKRTRKSTEALFRKRSINSVRRK